MSSSLPLPDLLEDWKWKAKIHPEYQEVAAEGNAWFRSFTPLTPKSQYAFDLCNIGLFAGFLLPDAPGEHLRAMVDHLNIVFMIDEYTDVQPSHVVRQMMDACIDAIRNPGEARPKGEVVLGEMVRQFWERTLSFATPLGAQYYVASFIEYVDSLVELAEWRDKGSQSLTLDKYMAIRMEDVCVRPLQFICGLYLSIPAMIFSEPAVREVIRISCELIVIDNDILSYNRERANGNEDFNLVTVIMHDLDLSLDETVQWLEKRNKELTEEFYLQLRSVPSFGQEIDEQLKVFLDYVGYIRRAGWDWSFAGGRYFGDRGAEYAKMGQVPLLPIKARSADGAVEILSIEELAKVYDV